MAAAVVLPATSAAQTPDPASSYPRKAVRLVVAAAPGGGTDIVARLIGRRLAEGWGQPVIVDNRTGGGGILGVSIVAAAAPDGYTLLVSPNNASMAVFHPRLGFDPIRSFAPITLAVVTPLVGITLASFAPATTREFIAYAKARPGQLNFGATAGSAAHVAGELFKSMAKIDMTFVGYNGIAPAVTAVLSNEIHIAFPTILLAQPHVRSGRARALGVTSLKRSEAAPDWPTIAESGVPGYEANIGFAFLAPAATPRAIVAGIQREIAAILQRSEVRQAVIAQGGDAVGSTPQELAALIAHEYERLGKLVRETGMRAE
jgi:tripartite-type tricarboxylate transporter receptor subunit TctC